ncbi:MFS-type transporter SLC18B1-like [Styela clava]
MSSSTNDILLLQLEDKEEHSTNPRTGTKIIDNRDSANKPKTVETSLWGDSTRKQIAILTFLLMLQIFVSCCASIHVAFFTRVVLEKGGSVLHAAIILQIYTAATTVFGPIFGKFQHKFGSRNLIFAGSGICGICQALLGTLQYVNNLVVFIAVGIALRFLTGIGNSAYNTAATTIACQEFPEHVSKVFGFLQAASGCTLFVAPALGGVLYEYFGMFMPLATAGGIVVGSMSFQYFVFPDYSEINKNKQQEPDKFNSCTFLLDPLVIGILCVVGIGSGVFGYCEVALTTYFDERNLSTSYAGAALFAIGVSYAIFSSLTGYVISWKPNIRPHSLILGLMGIGGVMWLFSIDQILGVVYFGAFLLGGFAGMCVVPAFEELLVIANKGIITKNTNTGIYSNVSGIWYANMGIGMTVIPIVTSAIKDWTKSPFSISFYGLSIFHIVCTSLLAIFMIYKKVRNRRN